MVRGALTVRSSIIARPAKLPLNPDVNDLQSIVPVLHDAVGAARAGLTPVGARDIGEGPLPAEYIEAIGCVPGDVVVDGILFTEQDLAEGPKVRSYKAEARQEHGTSRS